MNRKNQTFESEEMEMEEHFLTNPVKSKFFYFIIFINKGKLLYSYFPK
jgi:hypothetical protein